MFNLSLLVRLRYSYLREEPNSEEVDVSALGGALERVSLRTVMPWIMPAGGFQAPALFCRMNWNLLAMPELLSKEMLSTYIEPFVHWKKHLQLLTAPINKTVRSENSFPSPNSQTAVANPVPLKLEPNSTSNSIFLLSNDLIPCGTPISFQNQPDCQVILASITRSLHISPIDTKL